jgi:hypothetical protein
MVMDVIGKAAKADPVRKNGASPKANAIRLLNDDVHVKNPPRLIWLSVGSSDTVAGQSTQEVKNVLESKEVQDYFDKNNVTYIYYKMPTSSSHTWPEWRNGLYNFTQIIFK